MGKMFIIVSTIILLLVVIQRNTSNNIRLFKRLKNIIFEEMGLFPGFMISPFWSF